MSNEEWVQGWIGRPEQQIRNYVNTTPALPWQEDAKSAGWVDQAAQLQEINAVVARYECSYERIAKKFGLDVQAVVEAASDESLDEAERESDGNDEESTGVSGDGFTEVGDADSGVPEGSEA